MEYRAVPLVCFVTIAAASQAWASPGQCNPNPPGTTVTYNLGTTGTKALVSPGGASAGCEQINNEFTNFTWFPSSNGPAGSSLGVQFTGSNETTTDMSVSGSWTGASPSPDSVVEFQSQLNPADTPPPPNTNWSLTGLNLALVGAVAPAGQVLIDLEFCTDATICNNSDGTHGNFGEIFIRVNDGILQDFSCYNDGDSSATRPCATTPITGSSTSFGVSLDQGVQSIAFNEDIRLLNGGQATSLSGFDITFQQTAQTPEPTGFVLVGAGLAILALKSRRFLKPRA